MEIALDPDETYLDAMAGRERVADVASLTALLRPQSVVGVGTGRRPGSVGNAVLGAGVALLIGGAALLVVLTGRTRRHWEPTS